MDEGLLGEAKYIGHEKARGLGGEAAGVEDVVVTLGGQGDCTTVSFGYNT